jgi:hypothetical protein
MLMRHKRGKIVPISTMSLLDYRKLPLLCWVSLASSHCLPRRLGSGGVILRASYSLNSHSV